MTSDLAHRECLPIYVVFEHPESPKSMSSPVGFGVELSHGGLVEVRLEKVALSINSVLHRRSMG